MTWLAIDRTPGASEVEALLALHPQTASALRDLVASARASVDPTLFELVTLRVGQMLGVERAVIEEIVPLGAAASETQLGALPRWTSSHLFDDAQRLAIGWAEQFVIDHTRLGDDDIARMLGSFPVDEFFRFQVALGIVERTLRFCRIFEVAPSAGSTP
jgi:alkylhydroperoxidase family enzyme